MAVRRPKKQQTATTPEAEKARLLKEIHILDTQKKAIEQAISTRKSAMQVLMNEAGDRVVLDDNYGQMAFTPRRSFRVLDEKLLQRRLSKAALVNGFKPTAAVVDALASAGVSIDGMIAIGVSENLVYRPPSTKEAEARRKSAIEQSRQLTEDRVAKIVATL